MSFQAAVYNDEDARFERTSARLRRQKEGDRVKNPEESRMDLNFPDRINVAEKLRETRQEKVHATSRTPGQIVISKRVEKSGSKYFPRDLL